MLAMVHSNPARLAGGYFRVDRKFHVGMLNFAREINAQLVTIHPANDAPPGIDIIDVPVDELPYSAVTLTSGYHTPLTATDRDALTNVLRDTQLICSGDEAEGILRLAKTLDVPYALVLEYDLETKRIIARSQPGNMLRKLVRDTRCVLSHYRSRIPARHRAVAIHCNGYPIYQEVERHRVPKVLYLDSRMTAEYLISDEDLEHRLRSRDPSLIRLLYSGRYEPMKGALDAVRVAAECLSRGLNIEFASYGEGSLREAMLDEAARSVRPDRISINRSVPYPELNRIAQQCDAFLCCHIQSDPSCTYLESLGAGLPIVGYGNRMWKAMCDASQAGYTAEPHDVAGVSEAVSRLFDAKNLGDLSYRAVRFAREHLFEAEHRLRIDGINALLRDSSGAAA